MNNKYLLTGASGFLGKILGEKLGAKGEVVIGLDRIGQALQIDITKPFSLDNTLIIDTVVHCAGKAHVIPRNEAEIQSFYQVNYEGTKHLCAALERLSNIPKAFVFISTVAVYGVDSARKIDEAHPLKGETPYAKSKIQAEDWLRKWGKKNGIRVGIVRLPLLAGPNPPGNLGAMINGIKTGKYLSIGKADSRKSVVWAEDIAELIPGLAEVGGTFNLTDGHDPSFAELERSIALALEKRLPIKIPKLVAKALGCVGDVLGSKAPINSDKVKKITSTLTFDDRRARKILGWSPSRVLDHVSEMVQLKNEQ